MSATGSLALPSFFELEALPAWQCIDFISDLHLCEAMPRTFAGWAGYLQSTRADAIFILGDLFELWVGDDSRTAPFARLCVETMADASSQRTLAVMVGNRDFLIGSSLLRDAGAMGLPDPTVLRAWGQPVLLTHGDALCLDDKPYQAFRSQVRSEAWQRDFLARPLAERQALAARMRAASQERQRFDGDLRIDIDASEAVRWMHTQGTVEMVHGHTHRPGSDVVVPGFKRHVLSDWDLDAASPRAEVLRLTRDGFSRLAPGDAT